MARLLDLLPRLLGLRPRSPLILSRILPAHAGFVARACNIQISPRDLFQTVLVELVIVVSLGPVVLQSLQR